MSRDKRDVNEWLR